MLMSHVDHYLAIRRAAGFARGRGRLRGHPRSEARLERRPHDLGVDQHAQPRHPARRGSIASHAAMRSSAEKLGVK